MANCCNENPTPGCVDCTTAMIYLDSFCQEGCKEYPPTDCVLFSGDSIDGTIDIAKGENLTSIIKKLIDANSLNGVDITWNASTRSLCLFNNGISIRCVTIADQDDQFLTLTGDKKLQIWKPSTSGNVMINEVSLATLFTQTTFAATSTSLTITAGGTAGHTPDIELEPSSDANNALIMGTDGKPYVEEVIFDGVEDIITNDSSYINFTTTIVDGVATISHSVNLSALAAAICPLCTPTCIPPTNLVATS